VRDVQATFADHGLRLLVRERNRVATILLPTPYLRAPCGARPRSERHLRTLATRWSFSRTGAGSAICRVIGARLGAD